MINLNENIIRRINHEIFCIFRFLIITLIILFALASVSKAKEAPLMQKQKDLQLLALIIGSEVGYPLAVQAILHQESLSGAFGKYGDVNSPFGKKSYGVMQIQLNTAKYILTKMLNKKLPPTDEELIVRLVTDDEYCIRLGAIYFKYLFEKFSEEKDYRTRWRKAILSYNAGIGNVKKYGFSYDPNRYLKKTIYKIHNVIRPYNRSIK